MAFIGKPVEKPEGAKVRLKSDHANRLHHASVIKKSKC